ncbi:MAG: hypothetical protein K8T26_02335 [Lentisphaerae bacterium]|nr:hypothetical protein [Lentisphaerota bacterium]
MALAMALLATCSTLHAAHTGWLSPGSYGPHNDWKNPSNAFTSDNADCNGSDNWAVQDFGGFHVSIPSGATIEGIELVVEWAGNNAKLCQLGVELSSDGGISYTLTGNNDTRQSTADASSTFGNATYTWGRSQWAATDFTDTVFRVRLEAMQTKSPLDVDWLAVRIHYAISPPAVDNNGGASSVTTTAATLNGTVTAGVPTPVARLYWGPTDGLTTPGAWSNALDLGVQAGSFSTTITGLLANQTNYYRCFVTNVSDGAWADDTTNFVTASPPLFLEGATFVLDEADAQQLIGVRLDITSAVPVSVNYATSNGTAEAGSDYTASAGTLTWAALETGTKTFAVTVSGDSDDESDEVLYVVLSGPTNATISGVTTATVVITDNDGSPTIRFAAPASSGPESITATNLLVSLTPVQPDAVTVHYAVTGGSATGEGDDYSLAEGTLTFEAGVTATGVAFTVANDPQDEPDETLEVSLSAPSAGALGLQTTHVYTIRDDDIGLPGVDNAVGAIHIGATSATLRGAVTNTGGENPLVFVYWGPTNGEKDKTAWSNRLDMGTLGLTDFTTNVNVAVSNVIYYYRCYATNSGGEAWAPYSENFAAEDPDTASLMFNPSLEEAGATADDALNWSRSDTARLKRYRGNARTGSYSAEYQATAGLTLAGVASNSLRSSWNGLLAEGGTVTHPLGGIRPGFVMSGTAYVRASKNNTTAAQFRYRWRNVDTLAVWMERAVSLDDVTPIPLAISNANPLAVSAVNQRFQPEFVRESAGDSVYNADDLTLVALLPRLHLTHDPASMITLEPTGIGSYRDVQLGARCSGGGANTVLYGAYITDPAELTNVDWTARAWFEASDPADAFEIVSGENLVATNDVGGPQYVTIRFTPPDSGSYTCKVRIATTDPTGHYTGGGTILNTIDYEEYTLVGIGVAPDISCTPETLAFSAYLGSLPASQRFYVTNSAGGTLVYTNHLAYEPGASDWLAVTPVSHTMTGAGAGRTNTLAVTASGLAPGDYTASVTVNGNQTNAAPVIEVTLSVLPLPDPGSVSAAANALRPASRIDVEWALNAAGHAVMVVRSTNDTFFTPDQGTPYAAGYTRDDDEVIYNSNAATSLTDLGRRPRTTYYYRLYSQNGNYYSAGADVSATCGEPQGCNTGGGPPEQPATVYLGDTNLTFGVDAWATLDGAQGRAQMVASTDANLAAGSRGPQSDYADIVHRTVHSPPFTSTGTWYWGIQLEYATYGTDFWYCRDIPAPQGLQATPDTPTLTLTVLALSAATGPTATPGGADPAHTIALTWIRDGLHPVMVVRMAGGSPPGSPQQGTHYNTGDPCGGGVVVHRGATSGVVNTGLSPDSLYTYAIFTENNDYYAPATSVSATTASAAPFRGTVFSFK